MANTIQQLQVLLGADTSGFEAGFAKAEGVLHHFGLNFNKVIGGLTFGAAVAGIVEVGEKFEQANIKIQRATGATGEKLESFEKSIQNIYATSGKSAGDIADALAKISIKTGETGAGLESLARSAMKFAKVTGSDLSQSIEDNQKVFAQWGIGASAQAEKLDKLYVITTQTGISTSQLSMTMQSAGAQLRAFGFGFEEAASIVGNFAKRGLDLNNVLGALSRGMVNLAESGKNPREELLRLIEKMQAAKNEAAAVDVAAETFGKRGAVVLSDAVRRGAFDTGELADKLKDARGEVAKIAEETKTFTDRWKELQHQVEVAVGPAATLAVEGANKGLAGMNDVMAVWQGIIPGLWRVARGEAAPLPNARDFVSNLPAPADLTGGGSGVVDLAKAFSALGLKDLNKELAESVSAFSILAGAGALTRDQMLQAAGAIQRLRDQIAGVRKLDLVGITPSAPGLSDLFSLPRGGELGKTTTDQLFDLPQLSSVHQVLGMITEALIDQANAAAVDARNAGYVSEAFHAFGMQTPEELQQAAKDAEDAFATLRDSGVASADSIQQAWGQMFKAQIDAQRATGKITREEYDELARDLKHTMGDAAMESQRAMEQFARRTSSSMARTAASAFVQWRGFGEAMRGMFTRLAEDLLSVMLDKLLQPLFTSLASALMNLFGGFGLSSLFSGASGGIGTGWSAPLTTLNDGIVQNGQVITTHPDDYIIATKTPETLGAGKGGPLVAIYGDIHGVAMETVDALGNAVVRKLRLAGARV